MLQWTWLFHVGEPLLPVYPWKTFIRSMAGLMVNSLFRLANTEYYGQMLARRSGFLEEQHILGNFLRVTSTPLLSL